MGGTSGEAGRSQRTKTSAGLGHGMTRGQSAARSLWIAGQTHTKGAAPKRGISIMGPNGRIGFVRA